MGLRLGRRPSQALFAVAQAGELQGRPGRPARHRRSGVRADEAPRRGDGLDPQGRGRRQDADRRRHHRAADDVRTGEGRAQGQGRPAGHAERARGEIVRRDRAAQPRRRHGRRRLRPGQRNAAAGRARERHRRRGQQIPLHPRLRRRRSGQRHFRRALQSAPAQFHRPHDPPGRPGLLRHPAGVHGLSHLLLPHLQRRAAPRRRSTTPTSKAREWLDNAIARIKPGASTAHICEVFPKAEEFGFPDEMSAFGLQFAHGLGLNLHERPIISRVVSMDHPTEIKEGMVFAIET